MPPSAVAQRLCLACGLCCNGVLFKDVELPSADDAGRMEKLGLDVQRLQTKTRLPQPCAALCADNRCRIYHERPARCREFECGMFQRVAAGTMTREAALRVISQTRARAERVQRLLRALGDADEHLPLAMRFRRTRRRVESAKRNDATAATFAELTLAVHDLNLRLARSFHVAAKG